METTLKEQLQSATSPQKPECYHCRQLTSFLGLMLMGIYLSMDLPARAKNSYSCAMRSWVFQFYHVA